MGGRGHGPALWWVKVRWWQQVLWCWKGPPSLQANCGQVCQARKVKEVDASLAVHLAATSERYKEYARWFFTGGARLIAAPPSAIEPRAARPQLDFFSEEPLGGLHEILGEVADEEFTAWRPVPCG